MFYMRHIVRAACAVIAFGACAAASAQDKAESTSLSQAYLRLAEILAAPEPPPPPGMKAKS